MQKGLLILGSLFVFSFGQAEKLRSSKALSTRLKDGTFTAQLEAGYHFNDKAPNGIQIGEKLIKPATLLPQSMTIPSLDAAAQNGVAQVYVCDDKVTFCETHSIPLSSKSQVEKVQGGVRKPGRVNSHGFIVDDFEAALKKAQKEKKMILVDFGARWCPACIRLEDLVFGRKDFKDKTKNFIKTKIDIDVFTNGVVKDKYKVRGVPTLVFLNASGEEISRFYDYQPMSFIDEVLADIQAFPKTIIEMEKSELSEAGQKSLAIRYFFAGQYEKAEALMAKIKPEMKEYWLAKVEAARPIDDKDPTQKKKFIETLRSAIQADPQSSRSIVWRGTLVDALEDEKEIQKVARESAELTDKLLADDELLKKSVQTDIVGEYTGYEGFYVAFINAGTADTAKIEAKKAWGQVIQQGERYKVTGKTPGVSLRLLSAMTNAEEHEKALALVSELLKEKPQDGDLQRRKLRTLVELKRYKEAIAIGKKALNNSYGINEFYVVEPLAKAYIGMDKKTEARNLINKYMGRNEIHFASMTGLKDKLEKLVKAHSL